MSIVSKRYDFIFLFDVKDGNPNGDPDFANTPRFDPETFQGLVSDVCLKRKVREYVKAAKSGTQGFEIFIQQGKSLESNQRKPYDFKKIEAKTEDLSKIEVARKWMCENFFDVRAFGAVMSTTDFNCGQVRGPVQFTFSRSIDRVLSSEHGITRVAHTTQKDQDAKGPTGTMGNKHTVAYGLYRMQGFINANLAVDTNFTTDDLELLWKALTNLFDLDRSAARGLMAARHLFVFEHASALGEAPAHKLFDLIQVKKKVETPRAYEDYAVIPLDEVRHKLSAFPGVSVSDKINP